MPDRSIPIGTISTCESCGIDGVMYDRTLESSDYGWTCYACLEERRNEKAH